MTARKLSHPEAASPAPRTTTPPRLRDMAIAIAELADEVKRERLEQFLAQPGLSEDDIWDAQNALGYMDRLGVQTSFATGARCGDLDDHPFSAAISTEDY